MRSLTFLVICILFFSSIAAAQKTKSTKIPVCNQTTELMNLDLDVSFSEQRDNKRVVVIRSQIENDYVNFVQDEENILRSKLTFRGKIANISGTKSGTFESEISNSFDKTDHQKIKAEKTELVKKVLLSPGIYNVDLFISDDNSKWCGKKTKVFTVPKNEAEDSTTFPSENQITRN